MSHGPTWGTSYPHEPEDEIPLQFQVLKSRHNLFNELHEPIPDLVGDWTLQLAEVLLQKPEQDCVGPAYNRERPGIEKLRPIPYSVMLDIGFLYLSGMVDNRRYMLSQSM